MCNRKAGDGSRRVMQTFRLALSGWLLFGLAACGGAARREQLRVQAASDLSCAKEQLTVEPVPGWHNYEKARGCGKELSYTYDTSQKKWVSPLERAAFEMSCEKAELQATHIDSMTVGVSGCGKKTVYKLVAISGWVLDSASSEKPD